MFLNDLINNIKNLCKLNLNAKMNPQNQNPQQKLQKIVDDKLRDLLKDFASQNINNIDLYTKKVNILLKLREPINNKSNYDAIIENINSFVSWYNDNNTNQNDYGKSLFTNATQYLDLLRNSTQSLAEKSTTAGQMNKINDPALGLELFRTYRSIIEHEGTLLNQRINWFVATQAFLLAGVGVAIGANIAIITPALIIIISCVGWRYSQIVKNPHRLTSQLSIYSLIF